MLASVISGEAVVFTVRNMGYEKGKLVQAEGKLVKWVEDGHFSPFSGKD